MDLNVLHNPFIDMLGAQLVEWQPGQCTWQLALAAHHTNTQGSLHGGGGGLGVHGMCSLFSRPASKNYYRID